MILRIVGMKVRGKHRLYLEFNNGARKCVHIAPLLEGPVFEPLRSAKYFAKAKLDSTCGTVVWPNGADLAPETLFGLTDEPANRKRPTRRKALTSRSR